MQKNSFHTEGRKKRIPDPAGFMEFGLLWNTHQGLGTVSRFSWGAPRLEFHMLVPIFFWCWQSCLFYWKHLPLGPNYPVCTSADICFSKAINKAISHSPLTSHWRFITNWVCGLRRFKKSVGLILVSRSCAVIEVAHFVRDVETVKRFIIVPLSPID